MDIICRICGAEATRVVSMCAPNPFTVDEYVSTHMALCSASSACVDKALDKFCEPNPATRGGGLYWRIYAVLTCDHEERFLEEAKEAICERMEVSPQTCDACKRHAFRERGAKAWNLKKCSRCMRACYCDAQCQLAAWSDHKDTCIKSCKSVVPCEVTNALLAAFNIPPYRHHVLRVAEFLNVVLTVCGRYGCRTKRDPSVDITLECCEKNTRKQVNFFFCGKACAERVLFDMKTTLKGK